MLFIDNKQLEKNFILKAETIDRTILYTVLFKNRANETLKNVWLNVFIPDNTKFKENSMFINRENVEDKFIQGLKIRELPVENQIEMKYTVECTNTDNINIFNKAKLTFDIGENQTIDIYSNEVMVDFNKKTICDNIVLKEFINEDSEVSALIGESVKYSTKVQNISEKYIDEIKINFQSDKNIAFDAQYIKIRDKMKRIDINKEVYIEEIGPQEVVEFYFNIRILKSCTLSEIQVKGNIEYTYVDEGNKPNIGKLELEEFKIYLLNNEIIGNNSKVAVSIKSDKQVIIKGKEALFKLIIKNDGIDELYNSVLKIENNQGVKIDTTSFKINNYIIGTSRIKLDQNGVNINIGNLAINEIIIIKFIIDTSRVTKRTNKLLFKIGVDGYLDNEMNDLNKKEFKEDIVKKFEDLDVIMFLNANKDFLIQGDEVIYSNTIINNGSTPVDIVYTLNVDKGLDIKDELKVNDLPILSKNNFLPYSIKPGDGVNIERKYTYNRSYGKEKLMAEAIVNCKFNIGGYTEELIKKSEPIYINADITVLKEFSIEDSIDIFNIKPKLNEIVRVNTEIDVLDFYIINIKRNDFDSCETVGKKVRFRGCIKYIVEYLSNNNEDIINLFYKEKTFSESIYLPEDYVDGELDEVRINIEDIYYKLIDDNLLFINLNLIAKTNL